MTDFSHLDAIELRLSHERARVLQEKTKKAREWREHNVRMIEQERDSEIKFLERNGVKFPTLEEIMSDDELLVELGA
ncbi:hypothetical protein [Tardiphaga sp. 839_C3_N1_4]|uniref:hypothetical protein n=1 Tax=Tardiphaga sp. 839_C3_N1_4 TaxID=3240761 RepID=UPI003F290B26